MRLYFTIVVCLVSCFAFTQHWEDSLRAARTLYHQQKYDESLQKYKSAQRNAPPGIDLSDEMGQTAYKAEQFEQAQKLYDQSVSKKGSSKQRASAYHNLGNAKFKQKKYDEAIEAYKEALRQNPKDEETRYNLAEAMKKRDKQQQQNQQQNQQGNKQNQPKQSGEQNKPQQNTPGQQKQPSNQQAQSEKQGSGSKLNDVKTEKALDELVKREMETKKKLGANKVKSSSSKSGKDW